MRKLEPERLLDVEFLKAFALLALAGASVVQGLYALVFRDLWPDYLAHNRIPEPHRAGLLGVMALGTFAALALVAMLQLRSGRRFPERWVRAARRASPLTLTALVPPLVDPRSWQAGDLTVLVLIPLFGWGLYKTIRLRELAAPDAEVVAEDEAALAAGAAKRFWVRLRSVDSGWRHLPLAVVVGAVLAYSVYFSHHTIQTHYRFGTSSYDLGLEDNLVWNAAHGGPLFQSTPFAGPGSTHAGNHQTYFAYVLAPAYRFHPSAETLLVAQALLMGATCGWRSRSCWRPRCGRT